MQFRTIATFLTASAAALFGFLHAPQPANACSIACPSGATTPGANASVPANDSVIYWRTPRPSSIQKSDIQLSYQASPGGPSRQVQFKLRQLTQPNMLGIEPTKGYTAGVTYHLVGKNCSRNGIDVRFDTTKHAEVPDMLGTLKVTDKKIGQVQVEHGAACSQMVTADRATATVKLSEKAKPWADVLRYQTFVDGQPWNPRKSVAQMPAPGASWMGRGSDLLYAYCGTGRPPSPNLSPGRHTVHMKAYLTTADQTKTYQTNKVQFTLDCGASEPSPDVGTPADTGPDTSVPPDTHSRPDTAPDTGPRVDVGMDAGPDTRPADDTSRESDVSTSGFDAVTGSDTANLPERNDTSISGGGGCACETGRDGRFGPGSSSALLAVLFALGLRIKCRYRC